jgi:hypothetical protein
MIFGEIYNIEKLTIEKPKISLAEKKKYLNLENPKHSKLILNQLKNF